MTASGFPQYPHSGWEHDGLAHVLARRYGRSGQEYEDRLQACRAGIAFAEKSEKRKQRGMATSTWSVFSARHELRGVIRLGVHVPATREVRARKTREGRAALLPALSIDANPTIIARLGVDSSMSDAEDRCDVWILCKRALKDAIDKPRTIRRLVILLLRQSRFTLEEIGRNMSLSVERVRALEAMAFKQLAGPRWRDTADSALLYGRRSCRPPGA